MTVEELTTVLLVGSLVVLVAIAAVRISVASGLPSLIVYLALGLVLGEAGLGIEFENAELTIVLSFAALIVIITEGGLDTRWRTVRPVLPTAVSLATVGVLVSTAVTMVLAKAILDISWLSAALIGAVISSTDAAAVFSVLRRVPLPRRLTGLLEAESGSNDPLAIVLVVAFTEVLDGGASQAWWVLAALAIYELVIGAALGAGLGWLGSVGLRRVALPASGLYPLTVLAITVASYAVAELIHASGFAAVYLAAIVLGNARLPHGAAVRGFAEGLSWIAQIGLFVMLGLLVSPGRLPSAIVPALLIGLGLLLLSRPISVLVSTLPFGVPPREMAFLSWAGLRGAVPIVLATIPVAAGVPGSDQVLDIVFVLVVGFTLLQAPTLQFMARKLHIGEAVGSVDLDVEVSPLGSFGADIVQVSVGAGSQLHGVEVFELRLPPKAVVSLIVRGDQTLVPDPQTRIEHGDELLLVVPVAVREQVERRLEAVSRHGRLAGWFGDDAG